MAFLHRAESVTDCATDWTQVGLRGHAVQFYEHDEALTELLAAYIGTALVKGHAAVVIATKKHCDDLQRSLALRGLDVLVAKRQGRYEVLDAAATLPEFTDSEGWPDRERFTRLLEGVLARVTSAVRRERPAVAAFGEMVALLCSSGKYSAALRLEELWNDLARQHVFSLCCAYPMSLFKANEAAAARFMKVCAQHSHVFPAERSPGRERLFVS
jgi:hypothetical protein